MLHHVFALIALTVNLHELEAGLVPNPSAPVANAINALQACIYKSVNHLLPQVLPNSTFSCIFAKELGI